MLIDEGFAWLILEIVREIPCGKSRPMGRSQNWPDIPVIRGLSDMSSLTRSISAIIHVTAWSMLQEGRLRAGQNSARCWKQKASHFCQTAMLI